MLSERGERIGQWVALCLFAVWLIVGGWPRDTAAQQLKSPQPCQPAQVQTVAPAPAKESQSWWDEWGPPSLAVLIAALGTGLAGWWIADYYTGRLKQIEMTLEFSKRFHELIQQQRELNAKFEKTNSTDTTARKIAKEDAKAWWWRFFDLLLYEYDFYQQGLVRKRRFEEWMIWRWHDYHPDTDSEWKTCDMTYKDGYKYWKGHPVHGGRLIELLDEIHDKIEVPAHLATDVKARNQFVAERVLEKLKPHAPRWPRWWRRDDLERGRF